MFKRIITPAAILLALPSLTYALHLAPGQTGVLNTTQISPLFAGDTIIDHQVATADLVLPGGTMTVELVTNVYRTPGGTLTFAYNLNATDFTSIGSPTTACSLPALNLSGLAGFAVNAEAENIPDAAPSGSVNPKQLTLTRSADGDSVQYLFATNTTGLIWQDNTLFPPQLQISTPAVVFVETDATDYITLDGTTTGARVDTHTFAASTPSDFTTTSLLFASFAPIANSGAAPVPEPMSLVLLPLAVGALALRRRIS